MLKSTCIRISCVNVVTALFGMCGTEWGVLIDFVSLISYTVSTGSAKPST